MDDRIYTTKYGDTAVVNLGNASFYRGTVRMISERGINVSSDWGNTYVKWVNVKEIENTRPDSEWVDKRLENEVLGKFEAILCLIAEGVEFMTRQQLLDAIKKEVNDGIDFFKVPTPPKEGKCQQDTQR